MIDVEKIIRKHIDSTVHMSLATVSGSKPWVCEVHFAYDDGLNLYFVSKTDTRHCREIATNPNVAGNIVRQHALDELPHGIYFEGLAEVIDATEEDIKRYCERLNRDESQVTAQLNEANVRGMYKIKVANWAAFGKFEDSLLKYELKWDADSHANHQ